MSILDKPPFEPDLNLGKRKDSAEEELVGLPDFYEEYPESDSEEEEEEDPDHKEVHEKRHLGLLRETLSHLAYASRASTMSSIQNSKIVAWSLDNLRPADVPVSHSFEL